MLLGLLGYPRCLLDIEAYDAYSSWTRERKSEVTNLSKIGSWSPVALDRVLLFASPDAIDTCSFMMFVLGSSSESDLIEEIFF